MWFYKLLAKVLIMLAFVLVMALPFFLEYWTFNRDKENKISYKRFRMVLYTLGYMFVITFVICLLKDYLGKISELEFVKWLADKIALKIDEKYAKYLCKVYGAILVNFSIGALFWLISKAVRIGLKKKSFTEPSGKNNELTTSQKHGKKIIFFFHKELWFFVGKMLKYISVILSVGYGLVFMIYQVPAVFSADWIPYEFISNTFFDLGYVFPTITLLGLWEAVFFLKGIERLSEEYPQFLEEEADEAKDTEIDLAAIDEEVHKQFGDFYTCDVDISLSIQEKLSSAEHHRITELIAQAVENDKRNPHPRKEAYMDCVDKLIDGKKGLLVNGSFFSEFSMYFLRYLSAVIARGDNVVFVCNTESQIDAVYNYLVQGFSEISSLYCQGYKTDAVDFDEPIWRVVKVSGERDVIEEASVDENNILVTSLGYLCSSRFENEHSRFITLIDAVVFVDTINTVNKFNRQLAILNTRLKHITKRNAVAFKNTKGADAFRLRYVSRQIRYICFDDTRIPGLDKMLKNMLSVDFDSVDAMNYNPATKVRCYRYEGKVDENGRRTCPQFFSSEEEVGAVMNMAVLCLAKGASNVTVFTDELIPYANIAETIASNMGQVSIKTDGSNIRLNRHFYNSDNYSVIIAVDSGDNLPATVRRYLSMVSDKPALLIVFSRPYMLRDYYVGRINEAWNGSQIERIPVEEGTLKDVAQRVLVKANAGGISKDEVLRLAMAVPSLAAAAAKQDVNSILRTVLQTYGVCHEDSIDLFNYFEYSSSQDFDEEGKYNSEVRIVLRRQGKLFNSVNGRDMVVMIAGDYEIILPVPASRLTQNFIAGQNFLHNGNIYYIQRVDTASGRIYARLAVGGKNNEVYQYVQDRHYHAEIAPEQVQFVFPTKHIILNSSEEDVSVNDVYVSAFRAPLEVMTNGYFDVDPHTLARNSAVSEYHSINDKGNDALAKQTYRRYGKLMSPKCSTDSILKDTALNADENGTLMMLVRICGQFGDQTDKAMVLAATMLNELLRSMFPSVADSIAVCPLAKGVFEDEESKNILGKLPDIEFTGDNDILGKNDFQLVIVEDCATDLGVVSVLMSSGDSVITTLFEPIFNYLKWYFDSEEKNDYLYFGLDHEPACFSFDALYKLSKLLGDNAHDIKYVDIAEFLECDTCDFCGKRYTKSEDVSELQDGRKMCKSCAANLVGNNKKLLRQHFDRAKMFLESTYGLALNDDYEVCFESTTKIVNTLKQNSKVIRRGADVPLKSFIDENKKINAEYSLPSVNLSELLVRELTHTWQLKHLPDLSEEYVEGLIALVSVQHLKFLNQTTLAATRSAYYESTANPSGVGYRKLVRELLNNPRYNNNPFRYLIELSGVAAEDDVFVPDPGIEEVSDYGDGYTTETPDRDTEGTLQYFYRNRLTADMQGVYDTLLTAIKQHAPSATVDCTFADVDMVTDAIAYDHPEIFWYNTVSMSGSEVFIHYGATQQEAELLNKRMEEVIPKYLEGITDGMSGYDVALRIHTKIISAVDYDTIALNKQKQAGGPDKDSIDYLRTICGVFLEGKAVCEGYARAMQYLLQRCGIECAEAAGFIRKETGEKGEAHAWNILKLDGDYYYLDTTWDDSSNTVQSVSNNDLGFNYFCITTEELCRTREIDLCPTPMPRCEAVKANYYHHNGFVLESYDLDKIKHIAQVAAKGKNKSFTVKFKTRSLFEQAINSLCVSGQDCFEALKAASKEDKSINPTSFMYSTDKNIWTITVKFKYK